MFVSYALVFLLAAIPLFEVVVVVPLAILGGLHPLPVAVLAFLGNAITVLLVIAFVDRLKSWKRARKRASSDPASPTKKEQRAKRLFDRYGLPGLSLIGPFFVGSHISALMAMGFGSSKPRVTLWMMISLAAWTVVTAVATGQGVSYFAPDLQKNGFLTRIFQQ